MSNLPSNERRSQSVTSRDRWSSRDPGVLRALYERSILTWRLFWDNRVSLLPKLIPLIAVIYTVSPVDLAPMLFLGPLAPLGTLDDVGIILIALGLFVQACPPDIVQEHRRELGAAAPGDYPDTPLLTSDEDVVDSDVEILE